MERGVGDSGRLTKDKEKIQMYLADPLATLSGGTVCQAVKFLYGMLATQRLIPELDCSFLVVHGEDDEIAEVSGSWKLYHQARSQNKEIKVYPNCRHVLLLEIPEDSEMVKQDILDWFLTRLNPEMKST
ncbi:monoglyceride lipase-like [Branchiostoma floridae x Branchiostoma japonicum]